MDEVSLDKDIQYQTSDSYTNLYLKDNVNTTNKTTAKIQPIMNS